MTIGKLILGANPEKDLPIRLVAALGFEFIVYACSFTTPNTRILAVVGLPICFIPAFGFFAVYCIFWGIRNKKFMTAFLGVILGITSGGIYMMAFGFYGALTVFASILKIFGVNHQVGNVLQQIIHYFITPTPIP